METFYPQCSSSCFAGINGSNNDYWSYLLDTGTTGGNGNKNSTKSTSGMLAINSVTCVCRHASSFFFVCLAFCLLVCLFF